MTRAVSSGVTMRIVDARDDGLRLDRWFRSHYPALGHGALEKMLRKGQIRVAGSRVKANFRVSAGDEIRVPPDVPPDVPPECQAGQMNTPRQRVVPNLMNGATRKRMRLLSLI